MNNADLQAAWDALTDKDPQARITAVERLGEARVTTSLERIAALLNDGQKPVRQAAANALAQIGEPAIPVLIQSLRMQVGGYYGRFQARDSLAAIGLPARPALLELLHSTAGNDWRAGALYALAGMRDGQNLTMFIEFLAESHADLHTAAVVGLDNLGARCVPALEQALDHPNSRVRQSAIRGLGRLRLRDMVPRLMTYLDDPDTIEAAAWALRNIGDEAARNAFAALLQLAKTDTGPLRVFAAESIASDSWNIDSHSHHPEIAELFRGIVRNRADSSDLRHIALDFLAAQMSTEEFMPVLADLLDERPRSGLTGQVLFWLSETSGDERIVKCLIVLASDAESIYRGSAEYTLFQFARYHSRDEAVPPSLLDYMLNFTGHAQVEKRAQAIMGLGGLRSPDAIPALVDRLDDKAEYQLNVGADEQPEYETVTISELAVEALEKIGTPEALTALEAWRGKNA